VPAPRSRQARWRPPRAGRDGRTRPSAPPPERGRRRSSHWFPRPRRDE
jgi:hypothetical protein